MFQLLIVFVQIQIQVRILQPVKDTNIRWMEGNVFKAHILTFKFIISHIFVIPQREGAGGQFATDSDEWEAG